MFDEPTESTLRARLLRPVLRPLLKPVLALCGLVLATLPLSSAAFLPNSEDLPEQVIMLETQKNPEVQLETTIFKPDGAGPFPLVIVNHGSTGFPRQQWRDRPLSIARYFLERGYMVAAPMRQGFSKSTGTFDYRGCDVRAEALAHAQDIRAALVALAARPDVDGKRVLLIGQSHGGLATLAAGSLQLAGVRGTVVFAGVMGSTRCWNWPVSLIDASTQFGKTARTPSLWFYGANDHYIPQGAARSMASAYDRAGGFVRLVAFPDFKNEAHYLSGDPDGREIWEKPLTDFLEQTGMPHDVTDPQYLLLPLLAVPAASHFAALDDASKLPLVGDQGRQSYREFLSRPESRAFAISGDGASGWLYGHRDNPRGALQLCATFAKQPCFLYAVDSTVVWNPDNVPHVASAWQPTVAYPAHRWLQWGWIAVGLSILILNVARSIGRLRNSLSDDRSLRDSLAPRVPGRFGRSTPMRVTKTGIVWGLALIAIPIALFIHDPLSPWFRPLEGNAGLVIFGLFICYLLGGEILKSLGYPIGEITVARPDTAKSLTAKAVKNGYRRL